MFILKNSSYLIAFAIIAQIFCMDIYALAPTKQPLLPVTKYTAEKKNITFILSSIGGADGVSLEVMQRIEMLLTRGYQVTVFAGRNEADLNKKFPYNLSVKEVIDKKIVQYFISDLNLLQKSFPHSLKVFVSEEASLNNENEINIFKGMFGFSDFYLFDSEIMKADSEKLKAIVKKEYSSFCKEKITSGQSDIIIPMRKVFELVLSRKDEFSSVFVNYIDFFSKQPSLTEIYNYIKDNRRLFKESFTESFFLLCEKVGIVKNHLIKHITDNNSGILFVDNLQMPEGQFILGMAVSESLREINSALMGNLLQVVQVMHDFPDFDNRAQYWPMSVITESLVAKLTDSANYPIVINREDGKRLNNNGYIPGLIERNWEVEKKEINVMPNTYDYNKKPLTITEERSQFINRVLNVSEDEAVFLLSVRPVERKRLDVPLRFAYECIIDSFLRLSEEELRRHKFRKGINLLVTHPENRSKDGINVIRQLQKGAAGLNKLLKKKLNEIITVRGLAVNADQVEIRLIHFPALMNNFIRENFMQGKAKEVALDAAGSFFKRSTSKADAPISLNDLYKWVKKRDEFAFFTSDLEGFGNAALELAYYKIPFVINNYDAYEKEIKPYVKNMLEINLKSSRDFFHLPLEAANEKYAEKILSLDIDNLNQMVDIINYSYLSICKNENFTALELLMESIFEQIKDMQNKPSVNTPEEIFQDAKNTFGHDIIYLNHILRAFKEIFSESA